MLLVKYFFIALLLGLTACASVPPDEAENMAAATVCEDPRPQVCTMDYRPVCGTLGDGSVKTHSNGCGACSDAKVTSWVEGECPE